MKIYLAGPEVFFPQALDVLQQKATLCQRHQCVGVSPFDNAILLKDHHPASAAKIIFDQNIALIAQSDAVIANITPFRGPHMDPGTAFEVGYALALNKPVVCYTQDDRDLIERVGPCHLRPMLWGDKDQPLDRPLDKDGVLIENFGLSENLMIAAPCPVVRVCVPKSEHFFSTSGFAEALAKLLHHK